MSRFKIGDLVLFAHQPPNAELLPKIIHDCIGKPARVVAGPFHPFGVVLPTGPVYKLAPLHNDQITLALSEVLLEPLQPSPDDWTRQADVKAWLSKPLADDAAIKTDPRNKGSDP